MFFTQSDNCILICPYFDVISLFATKLEETKIGICGEGLRTFLVLLSRVLFMYFQI